MPAITKVVATTVYRNYQYEVSEEFVVEHFGSLEAFRAAFSGDAGELDYEVERQDFFEALEQLDWEVVERMSEYDETPEYFRGRVEKCDRWVERKGEEQD
jgi:hypothetical protein